MGEVTNSACLVLKSMNNSQNITALGRYTLRNLRIHTHTHAYAHSVREVFSFRFDNSVKYMEQRTTATIEALM